MSFDPFAVYEGIKKVYDARDKRMAYHDKLYRGDVDCYEFEGQPGHIPPVAYREVEKAVGQISVGFPVLSVTPDRTGEHKKSGDKIKHAYTRTVDESDLFSEVEVNTEVGRYLALRGMGVRKLLFLRGAEWPIVFPAVDPMYFYPSLDGKFVVEAYERHVCEVKEDVRRWNEKIKKESLKYNERWMASTDYANDYDKVLFIEYWTPTHKCFAVTTPSGNTANDLSGLKPNPFGFIPYTWRYSGRGKGLKGAPEERAIGVLFGQESSIEAQSRLYTALDYNLRYNVYGVSFVRDDAADDYKTPVGPGQARVVRDGNMPSQGAYEESQPKTVSPDLYNFIQLTEGHLIDLGGDPSLLGQSPTDDSGIKTVEKLRQSMVRFTSMRKAMEAINSDCALMMAKVIANEVVCKEPLPIGDKTISAKDIFPNTRIKVKMEPRNPIEDNYNMELGMRLQERGLITRQMFADMYAKFPDSGDYLAKILAENVMFSSQAIIDGLAMEGAKQQGMDEVAQMISGESMGQNAGSHTQTVDERAMEYGASPGERAPEVR